MNIVFIGTVRFSERMLECLIQLKASITGVITKQNSSFNADFADLSALCKKNDIPCLYAEDVNLPHVIQWIKKSTPDIIFCFGWSSLLKKEILTIPRLGVVGFHPAALPKNRGRHPLVWALVLGLLKTASTFFFIDENADSGDILSQEPILIDYSDNAQTLYNKIEQQATKQIKKFLPELIKGTYKKKKQNHKQANYWRKRQNKDGQIDFRMSSRAIYNLVRALTTPYVGAYIEHGGKEIKVWEAEEIKYNFKNCEYGKILEVVNNKILVKCYDNAILLKKHGFDILPKEGEYL